MRCRHAFLADYFPNIFMELTDFKLVDLEDRNAAFWDSVARKFSPAEDTSTVSTSTFQDPFIVRRPTSTGDAQIE